VTGAPGPRIGAHVPARGSLTTAISEAHLRGAEAIQIFLGNPRAWAGPRVRPEDAAEFHEAWEASGLGPLFVHAPYVLNVASPNPEFLLRSLELGRRLVAACEAIGADGLVVHAGAGGPGEARDALERAAASLGTLVSAADRVDVAVELMAGTAGSVASTFPEAVRLFEAIEGAVAGSGTASRLRLCLDTCHLFATGYALDEPEGVDACFEELGASGLAELLTWVHANDARFPRGSRRDRHENLGDGRIGIEGFRAVLARRELAGAGVVLETPGDVERHRAEIELLRSLRP